MAKVTVKIPARTIEVDVDGWALEYGTPATAAAVRADARSYFDLANVLPDHLSGIVTVVK